MERDLAKDVTHIVILLALIGSLVFILTWTGVLHCRTIPGWCNAYWFLVRGGQPHILIVSGDSGMGDPNLLEQTLRNPRYAGVIASQLRVENANLGNLREYDLVIVERARKIETAKLRTFIEYVNGGGRLIWTGDAGIELDETKGDQYLYRDEDPQADSNEHVLVSPWARKDGRDIIAFHEFLGVNYQTNYCQIKPCQGLPWQGALVTTPGRNHPLVQALRPTLALRGDFALVTDVPQSITTRVLSLDWYSDLVDSQNRNYGRYFPLIVTSGHGERVAYYAVPPDQFVSEEQPEKYYSIVENIYYGMLR